MHNIVLSGNPTVASIYNHKTNKGVDVDTPEFIDFISSKRVNLIKVDDCGDFEMHMFYLRKIKGNQWVAFDPSYTTTIHVGPADKITLTKLESLHERIHNQDKKRFFIFAFIYNIYLFFDQDIFEMFYKCRCILFSLISIEKSPTINKEKSEIDNGNKNE